MPPLSEPPVVIVGAGLAGLACGLDLVSAGVPVRIVEAADGARWPVTDPQFHRRYQRRQ